MAHIGTAEKIKEVRRIDTGQPTEQRRAEGLKNDRQGQAWVRVARARRGGSKHRSVCKEQSGYKAHVRSELRGRRLPHGLRSFGAGGCHAQNRTNLEAEPLRTDLKMAKCRDCGVKLDWVRVVDKWIPFTNGVRHWDDCKAKAVLEIRRGEKITGARYTPSCEECAIPPWEVCGCSSLLAEG